jgi:autotransporter-associated beta strand protein
MPLYNPASRSRPLCLISLLVGGLSTLAPTTLRAATIQAGDITALLGPTFFIDDASNGGGDTDINQPNVPSYLRYFNGLLTSNQGPTRVILTGLGFAAHTSSTANDATTVAVTLTYLGADELVGGGDDVVIGNATGNFIFSAGGEYVFAFDNPLSADLNITGTRFRIQIAPSNASNTGSLKLKTPSSTNFTDAKLSVAGITAQPINPQRLNLAKFQPVTASSVNGQRLASYLTDGVVGNDNRWQGNGSAWQWAEIDFPFPVEIGSAQVFTGTDDANPIASYVIQFWNGTAWVNIDGASVSGNSHTERNLVFTNPVTASSFRFISSETNLRVKELALYAPNGPAGHPLGTDLTLNLAHQRPVVASANTTGNFALNAVDGRSNGKFWQTSTAGINTLDIDLRVSTKIGSVHLYSGSNGVSPLGAFTLKHWDGAAWQNITGGSITGNTTADIVLSFTPVTTSQVRLEFTNPGTASVRELQVFPANLGNTGYTLGTNIITSGSFGSYETYNDSYHLITNPSSGRKISVPNDGQPALDPPGLTSGQSQYQVLLNHSTGTYRLRNRTTGGCLSGALLDKTTGQRLTDAPYSAMPHQDWILDPLGSGVFRIINQWSGLAIDSEGASTTQGTALVQNTANASATQRWEIELYAKYPKKGIGGTTFANATETNWAYNWSRTISNPLPADANFLPMQWGNFNWDIGSNQGPIRQEYPNWRRRPDGIHLLGFNEPDRTDQSNMSLSSVISLWPRLQELDLPLVSPAPGTPSWLNTFYPQADALGYRVDYTAIHAYPGPSGGSSDNLMSTVTAAYTHNGKNRPVWLTEFSFVDWNQNQSWSEEDNYQCLAEFLWRAENEDKLRKYALFIFKEDAEWPQPANPWQDFTPAPRSNSYDINGNLTAFGKLYAAWDGEASIQTHKTYMIHHKGLRKRLANTGSTSTPNGRNIRVDGQVVNWTLVSTGVTNRYYLVSSIDGRRLSYTINANTDPTLAAAGTTGVDVEWSLTHNQHGWYYLGHPNTNTRLKMVSFNTGDNFTDYAMVAATATDDSVKWRFITAPTESVWTGASGTSWVTATNWNDGSTPATGERVSFNSLSTANLSTVLNQDFNLMGLRVVNPPGAVSISGTHTLTIGGYGIDLSGANQNLALNTPLMLDAQQGWTIASGRTLTLGGAVSGDHNLTISGAGKLSFNASNLLPYGAGNGNLILNSTLDLYGTSQSINSLSGTGVINNSNAGAASLTLGNNNTTITLSPLVQNTGGPLTLIKTGSGQLTLPNANTHSGGFTNNGGGNITPQNNAAFGTGPVVMNGGTVYTSAANYTITNSLALNAASLRTGGGNSRTLTWNGPVTATGNSGLLADTNTSGVTLGGSLDIAGASFTSNSSGVAHTLNGIITGTSGSITVTAGTLNVNAANTFSGSFRSTLGTLLLGNALALQNATLDMHAADSGFVSLNNLSATLGALTGTRNLALGSGAVSIGNNHSSTTYSGILSGGGSLVKTGNGTLTLSGANSYSGGTTITGGTLAMGASNSLPGAMTIGNATLDAATFTVTLGTLDVTSTAKINLGTGANLVFAESNNIDWTGGTLNITGTFVSGSSIKFSTSGGLTSTQLGLITLNGNPATFTLDASGFLMASAISGFSTWQSSNSTAGGLGADHDNDGVDNGLEWFLGGNNNTTGFTTPLPGVTHTGGVRSVTWVRHPDYPGFPGNYGTDFVVETSATLANPWTAAHIGVGAGCVEITGNNVRYTFATGSDNFARLKITGP